MGKEKAKEEGESETERGGEKWRERKAEALEISVSSKATKCYDNQQDSRFRQLIKWVWSFLNQHLDMGNVIFQTAQTVYVKLKVVEAI